MPAGLVLVRLGVRVESFFIYVQQPHSPLRDAYRPSAQTPELLAQRHDFLWQTAAALGTGWMRQAQAADDMQERLDKAEAENKVLKAELARVSTILAARERELVKMKGLASPEDEVF